MELKGFEGTMVLPGKVDWNDIQCKWCAGRGRIRLIEDFRKQRKCTHCDGAGLRRI